MPPQPQITTLEQYEALPEDVRAEVFDGHIYYMASPSQIHQSILLELSTLLNSYVKNRKGNCKVFPAPFDVKLSDYPLTIVQPDIMIVCDKDKLDENRCNGAPDFIIEIVSSGYAFHSVYIARISANFFLKYSYLSRFSSLPKCVADSRSCLSFPS